MERRVSGTAPETRCPQCGLVIKVTSQAPESCPVCGAKLPVSPSGPKGQTPRKGPIMLDQALFKSPRARESWAPSELVSAFLFTFFVVMIFDYLIVMSGADFIENDQFDPLLYFSINMASMLVGFSPVVYVLVKKTNVKKLAFKDGMSGQQWGTTVLLGMVFGLGLYAIQQAGVFINQAAGLVPSSQSQADAQYAAFIANPGNRLFLLVPVAVAQVVGEFFFRGTVQYGVLQWLQKRMPPLAPTAVKLRAWGLSVLLGTLFDFSLFFNPSVILPSLLVHAFVGWLFVLTKNVQAGMIAQGICMVFVILLA